MGRLVPGLPALLLVALAVQPAALPQLAGRGSPAGWQSPASWAIPATGGQAAAPATFAIATKNTTRFGGEDVFTTAVAISQAVYPATSEYNRPGAAILVRADRQEEAMLAVSMLHHPIDGAVLFTEAAHLPEVTRQELERLDPEGVHVDSNVQVYIVGSIKPEVAREVRALGLRTRQLVGEDAFELARAIDVWIANLESA